MNTPKHPCYGIWEVWLGGPLPGCIPERHDSDYYENIGTFEGYIDEIALQVECRSRDPVFNFRRAVDGATVEELGGMPPADELMGVAVQVWLPNGERLFNTKGAVAPFFEGRPVVADVLDDSYIKAIRLTPLACDQGPALQDTKNALEAALAKLSEAEIALLERHGLNRYHYSLAW